MKRKKTKFRRFFVTNRIGEKDLETEVNEWLNQFNEIDSVIQSVSVDLNPSPGYSGNVDLYMTVIYKEEGR